jgi:hypothetical protein
VTVAHKTTVVGGTKTHTVTTTTTDYPTPTVATTITQTQESTVDETITQTTTVPTTTTTEDVVSTSTTTTTTTTVESAIATACLIQEVAGSNVGSYLGGSSQSDYLQLVSESDASYFFIDANGLLVGDDASAGGYSHVNYGEVFFGTSPLNCTVARVTSQLSCFITFMFC